MLKDLQENLKKDKENTSNANNTVDTAPETPAEDKTSNKRQYETAFDGKCFYSSVDITFNQIKDL